MREEEKFIKSYDGELVYAKEYVVDNPKGTIIVTTDLKEHASLYENFAKEFTSKGYNVFTYDLRAHKGTAKEPFGTYTNNFFNDCVRDLLYLNKYLAKKYEVKTINVGVGFGSVVIVRMLQFYSENTINCLVGMPFDSLNIKNYFFRIWTRLTMVFVNKNSEAKLLNKSIEYFNKRKFEDGAYQSTNKDYIEQIKQDKFCNFNLSANILNSIYKGYISSLNTKNLNKIDKNLKFLITSGEYDKITDFSKSTQKFALKLSKTGIKSEKIIFKDLRHNLINESNTAFIEYLEKFIGEHENDNRRN